jgi:hypothetical protein
MHPATDLPSSRRELIQSQPLSHPQSSPTPVAPQLPKWKIMVVQNVHPSNVPIEFEGTERQVMEKVRELFAVGIEIFDSHEQARVFNSPSAIQQVRVMKIS